MFVAKKRDGSYFSLLDCKRIDELERITKGESFYCPVCNSALLLKQGQVRRIHFAHQFNSCTASSDPESPYHLEGKVKLYESFLPYNQPILEHHIPNTNQRADVYMETDYGRYAFEFQCSNLSAADFKRRTKLYEKEGIHPIWIIGRQFLVPLDRNVSPLKLSSFQWRFLQRPSPQSPPFILSFCPKRSMFSYHRPIFSINSSTTYLNSQPSEHWLEKPTFIKQQSPLWKEHYLHYKKKWRYQYSFYKPHQKLRSYCYGKMTIPLSLFPAEIGLPVTSFYHIHTSLIEWQAWLYFDSIYQTPTFSLIHLPSVLKNFRFRLKTSDITLRDLPLVKAGSYEDAIVEYMNALVEIGVLKRETPTIYRVLQKNLPLSSLEQAHLQDRLVLESLLRTKQSTDY